MPTRFVGAEVVLGLGAWPERVVVTELGCDHVARELPRLYAQADVFLFASLSEGFGLPPLEAMACGTLVVTSAVTSLPEVCGEAAFLVEPTEPERIFEAARRLLAEPELARSQALAGKARAREFTWKECARRTLLAYQAATKDEGGGDGPRLARRL